MTGSVCHFAIKSLLMFYVVMYATYYMYIVYLLPVGISNIIIVLFLEHKLHVCQQEVS
jgi:hypothetical protein